ncbi:MAG: cell division protein ZapA [Paludibacteraceae bacterium]|nr:cell division protein ZapA [Paludibacteraceae bacterium]
MSDETFVINVNLSGEKVALRVKRDEEIVFRNAERMLNTEFLYLAKKYGNASRETLFALLAFEVLADFQKGSVVADQKAVAEHIDKLMARIDEVMNQKI